MDAKQLSDYAEVIFSGRLIPALKGNERPGCREKVLGLRDVEVRLPPTDALDTTIVSMNADVDRLRLREGDVVVTSRTAKVRAAVAEAQHRRVVVGPNLIVIRPATGVPPHLIAALLRHPTVHGKLLAEFASRNPPGFTVAGLSKLPLRLPDLRRSQKLADLAQIAEAFAAAADEAARLRKAAAYDLIHQSLTEV